MPSPPAFNTFLKKRKKKKKVVCVGKNFRVPSHWVEVVRLKSRVVVLVRLTGFSSSYLFLVLFVF